MIDVDYSTVNEWNSGFQGRILLTNTGSSTVSDGWKISFRSTAPITDLWGANIISQSGDVYVVENKSWNATIAPGGTVDVGFIVRHGGSGGVIADVTLLDGTVDPEPVVPALSVADVTVDEDRGMARLTLHLDSATSVATSVDFATVAGTAGTDDFVNGSGTVHFAAGETEASVDVAIVDDTMEEGDESFTVVLSDPDGLTLDRSSATITIAANDTPVPPVVPSVSVADVTVDEDAGAATLAVTLSEPTTVATSIHYATSHGTADGADYASTSGVLTFQPGEITRTVSVAIDDDTLVEDDETVTFTLSDPDGLTIADGTATITIADDDAPATLPGISIQSAVEVTEGDPTIGPGADGWLSTSGSDIVDSAGNVVRITGVNWFGAETDINTPHGLWTRNYQDMMDQMKEVGFNALRLPFSNAMMQPGAPAGGIDYALNPDLQGLSAIGVLDAVIDYAGEIGLRVILDNHRNAPGGGPNGNGLWYGEGGVSPQDWLEDWEFIADRYKNNSTVIGFDLMNEPHGTTWGTGDPATDWKMAAEQASEAIHAINPNVLVLVEGYGDGYWWGGDLRKVATDPLQITHMDKLVYAPHAYPNSIYGQSWFSDPSYPDNLVDIWDHFFGFIAEDGIAPVLVGEFGSRLEDPKDVLWMDKFIPYLTSNDLSFTYWSWNPNSGDTGGILADDWTTIIDEKVTLLEPSLSAPLSGGDGSPADTTNTVAIAVTLAEASGETVTVDWATADGTATAGEDYVAASGSVTFAPGETSATISVDVVADGAAEGDEAFSVVLSSPGGGILVEDEAIVTILDDDGGSTGGGDGGTGGGDGGTGGGDEDDPNGDGIYPQLTVRETWNGGFVADGLVINDTDAAINGWTFQLITTAIIRDIWNASIISQSQGSYIIGNDGWTAQVDGGSERSWGFVADGLAAGLDIGDVVLA